MNKEQEYFERCLFSMVKERIPCDFENYEEAATISGEALAKAIWLRQHETSYLRLPEFELSHVTIIGTVDLRGAYSGRNNSLLALCFHNCTFLDDIDLRNATLTSLSMTNCKVSRVLGEGTYIYGHLEFIHLSSSQQVDQSTGMVFDDDWAEYHSRKVGDNWSNEWKCDFDDVLIRNLGLCHLKFNGCFVGTSLKLESSVMVAPAVSKNHHWQIEKSEYALDLSGATIKSGINFTKGSCFLGGISLNSAVIGGSIFFLGVKLVEGESDALNAQMLKISGGIIFRNAIVSSDRWLRSEAVGSINMLFAQIGGVLEFSGIRVNGGSRNIALELSRSAMASLSIQEDVMVVGNTTEIFGIINCSASEIQERVYVSNVELYKPSSATTRNSTELNSICLMNFGSAEMGELVLSGSINGSISLQDAIISHNLWLGAASNNSQPLKIVMPPLDTPAINLERARIGSSLTLLNFDVVIDNGAEVLRKVLKQKVLPAREHKLSFADQCYALEVIVDYEGIRRYLLVVHDAGYFSLLTGNPGCLHLLFKQHNLLLDNETRVKDYMKLYLGYTLSDVGPRTVIEPQDRLSTYLSSSCQRYLKPFTFLAPLNTPYNGEDDVVAVASVMLWHGSDILQVVAVLHANHDISITEDKVILNNVPLFVRVDDPLHRLNPFLKPKDMEWQLPWQLSNEPEVGETTHTAIRTIRKAAKLIDRGYRARPTINLKKTHVGELNDNDGNKWPHDVRLDLEGFTYDAVRITDHGSGFRQKARQLYEKKLKSRNESKQRGIAYRIGSWIGVGFSIAVMIYGFYSLLRLKWFWIIIAGLTILSFVFRWKFVNGYKAIHNTTKSWLMRRRWLRLQYESYKPTHKEFNPQPFEQLAQTYQRQGHDEDYRRISRLKLDWKHRTTTMILWRPFTYLYGQLFGYGFSIKRAVTTFLLCLAFGIFATSIAQQQHMLVLETTGDYSSQSNLQQRDCGAEISTSLYALDSFVPLIDIGQERRCRIRLPIGNSQPLLKWYSPNSLWEVPEMFKLSVKDTSKNVLQHSIFWRYSKAFYKLLGWIITSLTILTITGTLRRNSDS